MENVTIAIDAMGGDYGVAVTVPAALRTLKKHKNLTLLLVGDEEIVKAEIRTHKRFLTRRSIRRLRVHHASEQVAMDERPSKALRYKKDSSMRVAINLVKTGTAQACVSAGNTGALMAIARFVLKTLPGVDRPAIVSTLPTMNAGKGVRVLDLGANVDSCADNLYQFAVMGSVLTSSVTNIKAPKVGLLNIGEEEMKGNDLVKHAAQLLSECEHINYFGYVEGNDIFKGVVDVVVCDGFIGNIALKSVEGMAKLIMFNMRKAFLETWYSRFAAFIASPILKRVKKALDPGQHNGASLLGLQGIVVKSHGSADQESYAIAIEEAIREVEQNIPKRINDEVGAVLEEAEF